MSSRYRWTFLGLTLTGLALAGGVWMTFGPVSAPGGGRRAAQAPVSSAILALRQGHWIAVARGREHLAHHQPGKALEAVMQIRDEGSGAGEAMTVAGEALFQLGDSRSARLALDRALKLQPRQADAARLAATLSLATGDAVRGLKYLHIVTELDPADEKPWEVIGRVQHDLGEFSLAADAFREALQRNPARPEIVTALIAELLQAGRAAEATPWLQQALTSGPDDTQILGLAARQARDLGDADRALVLAEKALSLDSQNVDALTIRAKVALQAGQAQAAVSDLERAVQASPNDLRVLQLLAQAESIAGMTARSEATSARHRLTQERALAMTKLMEDITNTPDNATLRVTMGKLALDAGQAELARQCYQAALEIDPKNGEARRALASIAPRPQLGPIR